jgi:hypothetical protein
MQAHSVSLPVLDKKVPTDYLGKTARDFVKQVQVEPMKNSKRYNKLICSII